MTVDRRTGASGRRGDNEARTARRAARRDELLAAALTAIRRDGAGISMDAIAAEGGVTKPVLYKHVGDRDGLVGALAERFADDLAAEIGAALGADADPYAVLVATFDAYLAFVERDPDLYRFLVNATTGSRAGGAAGRPMIGLMPRIARDVALVIGEHLHAAGQDTGLAEPWAYALVGMTHATGDWWLERGTLPRARVVEALVALVWDGLAGRALAAGITTTDPGGSAP